MLKNRKGVREALEYPLFKAMARRRTRRFPLGCKMEEGTLKYESKSPPVPLNDIETALLCWAGAGVTGLIAADMPTNDVQGSMFTSWTGRTTPYACNVHNMKLFFTNDQGLFVYDPKKATRAVEFETEDDWDKIVNYFKKDTIKISDGRFALVPEALSG
jgi:ligand-binding sensor domain-containing protein